MKAIIMAGGTGTRLWPVSTEDSPKQFHAFVGDRTMLQQTYERLSFLNTEDIYVSTQSRYEKLVRAQLPQLKTDHLILEPAMRDTGPSICNSAHTLAEQGHRDEIMAIVYADHFIQNTAAFEQALTQTVNYAKDHKMFGVVAVKALSPNINLGYIKIGVQLERGGKNGLEVFELADFVEKPSLERAQAFVDSYRYFWNTGLYVGQVSFILDSFKKGSPEIYNAIAVKKSYAKAPKISIDYALIEKFPHGSMFTVPADLGWNDIGNWEALWQQLATDGTQNIVQGEHKEIDTHGCLIMASPRKLIATIGIDDLVIVDTLKALLIMPKNRAVQVKDIQKENPNNQAPNPK